MDHVGLASWEASLPIGSKLVKVVGGRSVELLYYKTKRSLESGNRDESYYEFGATATVSIMCLASQLLGLRDAQEYHVLHEVNLRVLYEDGKYYYLIRYWLVSISCSDPYDIHFCSDYFSLLLEWRVPGVPGSADELTCSLLVGGANSL
ncbi:hypothetical protein ASPFODRAFT_33879 [Aspergillus luchuensis CBS 106.47]|uniref:Uncharacterized protein n=1 Tax=Aspergillus luchuensis (strain CBS 106.47) TaxID=1137211 RepID=A0A1M3TDU0_ASPLC|nr:hypothetical protein ASPFODRAFT_33879 [Aspergillus luchuensis CBS 106.47]